MPVGRATEKKGSVRDEAKKRGEALRNENLNAWNGWLQRSKGLHSVQAENFNDFVNTYGGARSPGAAAEMLINKERRMKYGDRLVATGKIDADTYANIIENQHKLGEEAKARKAQEAEREKAAVLQRVNDSWKTLGMGAGSTFSDVAAELTKRRGDLSSSTAGAAGKFGWGRPEEVLSGGVDALWANRRRAQELAGAEHSKSLRLKSGSGTGGAPGSADGRGESLVAYDPESGRPINPSNPALWYGRNPGGTSVRDIMRMNADYAARKAAFRTANSAYNEAKMRDSEAKGRWMFSGAGQAEMSMQRLLNAQMHNLDKQIRAAEFIANNGGFGQPQPQLQPQPQPQPQPQDQDQDQNHPPSFGMV